MRATEHALRGPFYLLERRHGLAHPSAEILDRPVDVLETGCFCLPSRRETVLLLLDSGADVNLCRRQGKLTPLKAACMAGHCDIAEILIERGADVNHVANHVASFLMPDVAWFLM